MVIAEKQLNFYFDFLCPYSYIAWHILDQFAQEQELPPMDFLGIGFYPSDSPNLHNRHLWSRERWAQVKAHGAKVGIEIQAPSGPATLTFLPQRALGNYTGSGLREYISGIFRGRFVHDIDLTSTSAINGFLQLEGIDPIPFQRAVNDPNTLKLAQERNYYWGSRRIRLIPTLEIIDERYSGLFDRRGLENFLSLFLS